MNIEIQRFRLPRMMGTLSHILLETGQEYYGVEQPWRNNEPFNSCIPPGNYQLQWGEFNKWGDRFAFVGETVSMYLDERKSRYACLIHPANVPSQVSGCLALGSTSYVAQGQWGVGRSKQTVDEFEQRLRADGDTHEVRIWEM